MKKKLNDEEFIDEAKELTHHVIESISAYYNYDLPTDVVCAGLIGALSGLCASNNMPPKMFKDLLQAAVNNYKDFREWNG